MSPERSSYVVPSWSDRFRLAGVLVVAASLALGLVGCASSDDAKSGNHANSTLAEDSDQDTTPVPPNSAEAGVLQASQWEKVEAPESCQCSDGSPFHYWVHRGDADKVLFFLAGGGACFSAETCSSDGATYTTDLANDDGPGHEGLFDFDEEANPVRDYSAVYVPYCTGDLHLGTAVHDYGEGVVVHHNGYTNGSAAMAATADLFPDATQVVVAGSSAGSAGAPAYGGVAADEFPDADISVIADSSAAYPGTPEITLAIGGLWGIAGSIPPWPETKDLPVEAWSLPGLFANSALHDPDLRFATYNSAYDSVQAQFSSLIGREPDQLMDYIDENNKWIADQGVTIQNWVAPGTDHTVLTSSDLYVESVEGTSLIDWVSDFIAGKTGPDVHCTECEPPPAS